MNRTLLLVLCDFLLLTLLALTRLDQPQSIKPRAAIDTKAAADAATPQERDVRLALENALADERKQREASQSQLHFAGKDAKNQAAILGQLQSDKISAQSQLDQTQKSRQDLQGRFDVVVQESATTRKESEALRQDLQSRDKEIKDREAALKAKEKDLAAERLQNQQLLAANNNLDRARVIAEVERNRLTDRVKDLNNEVSVVRREKDQVQAHANTLANNLKANTESVGKIGTDVRALTDASTTVTKGIQQIATGTTQIANDIKANQTMSGNTLFNHFTANTIHVRVSAKRNGLFAPDKEEDIPTIIIERDAGAAGKRYQALFHVNQTPFRLSTPGFGWNQTGAKITKDKLSTTITNLFFTQADPRIATIPLGASQVAAMGVRPYTIAPDPTKFSSAILVSARNQDYSEIEFKIDPKVPTRYVRMTTKVLGSLRGYFNPSTGDLVFSRQGQLLGIMANSEYCMLLRDRTPAELKLIPTESILSPIDSMKMGANQSPELTAQFFSRLNEQLAALPLPVR